MARRIISIVGRPNVGKSTLFNRLAGYSRAIVKNVHGVTRDRHYGDIVWDDRVMTLVDTGGFFPDHEDAMFGLIREQALHAVAESDLVIHLLDGKEGINPLDGELADIIRASGKKALWVVNKIDSHDKADRLYEFFALGADELLPVSAETGYGIDDMMERVLALLPGGAEEAAPDLPKIAVVGRPNVGKSTLVNTLLGKNRMIVSDVAGTTRDAIDSICTYYRRNYLLIDTAGIRKKSKIDASIEQASVMRAIGSIERADVAVVVLDAASGITVQDQNVIGIALKKEKGIILLINKWDVVEDPDVRFEQLMRQLRAKVWFAAFAPVLTISALSRKRVSKLFPLIDRVVAERSRRVPTAELNRMKDAIGDALPPYRGKKVKLYYTTQVGVRPPAFTLFVNHPEGIKDHHLRMIERVLREHYPFEGTPVRILIRKRR